MVFSPSDYLEAASISRVALHFVEGEKGLSPNNNFMWKSIRHDLR